MIWSVIMHYGLGHEYYVNPVISWACFLLNIRNVNVSAYREIVDVLKVFGVTTLLICRWVETNPSPTYDIMYRKALYLLNAVIMTSKNKTSVIIWKIIFNLNCSFNCSFINSEAWSQLKIVGMNHFIKTSLIVK